MTQHTRPLILLSWLSLVSLSLVSAASAQAPVNAAEEEAQLHFEIGQRALGDGRYEEALREFERSFELSDRPVLLFNIGVANQRLRHDEAALTAYRAFMERVPSAEADTDVEQCIAVLERALQSQEPTSADAEPAPDLSPESAAQTTQSSPPPPDVSREDDEEEGGVLTTWWFWTLVGVVVVGAGVGIAIAATRETVEPLPSGFGPVAQTLSF